MVLTEESPVYGPFFGVMGAASAIIFSGKLLSAQKKENGRTLQIFNFFRKFTKSLTVNC